MYRFFFKRVFDIIFSFLGLVIFAPVMFVVAVFVRWFLGAPIIFKQQRPGYKGNIFALYKFRTMKDVYDSNGNLLPDAQRLTTLGVFLRRIDLDELPELWNILKGDMSFIGPRPLLPEYLHQYTEEELKRHDVRPGFAGLAESYGRNNLTWEEQFRFDVMYAQTLTFWLDIKILFLIIWLVLSQKGKKNGKWIRPKFVR